MYCVFTISLNGWKLCMQNEKMQQNDDGHEYGFLGFAFRKLVKKK